MLQECAKRVREPERKKESLKERNREQRRGEGERKESGRTEVAESRGEGKRKERRRGEEGERKQRGRREEGEEGERKERGTRAFEGRIFWMASANRFNKETESWQAANRAVWSPQLRWVALSIVRLKRWSSPFATVENVATAPSRNEAFSPVSSLSKASKPSAMTSSAIRRISWRSAGSTDPLAASTSICGGLMSISPGGASIELLACAAIAASSATAAPSASPPKNDRKTESAAALRISFANSDHKYCLWPSWWSTFSWADFERPWPRRSKRNTVRPSFAGSKMLPIPLSSSESQHPPSPWDQTSVVSDGCPQSLNGSTTVFG